ncbi:MAG TPA: hypothetical protein VH593_05775 [Ktedonobacteraceae bacterium]|jgi:hypothetical protein
MKKQTVLEALWLTCTALFLASIGAIVFIPGFHRFYTMPMILVLLFLAIVGNGSGLYLFLAVYRKQK